MMLWNDWKWKWCMKSTCELGVGVNVYPSKKESTYHIVDFCISARKTHACQKKGNDTMGNYESDDHQTMMHEYYEYYES